MLIIGKYSVLISTRNPYILAEDFGRAIAQAVSRWLPTAAARERVLSGHVGFVLDKVALGQVFSEYLGFSCQSSFHQILLPHNHQGYVL
jgi:hypothetical protein